MFLKFDRTDDGERRPKTTRADFLTPNSLVPSKRRTTKQWGVAQIHVLSVIASRRGLSELLRHHPDVRVTVGCVDDRLSEDGDVLPGLGDAGDRLYGTPTIDDEEELVHPSKRKRTMSVGE